MNIYIKNMSTPRCIHFVKQELQRLGIEYNEVRLGMVNIDKELQPEILDRFETALNALDLYIIQDKRMMLTEKIKQAIFEMVNNDADELPKENYSWYISKKLAHNYTYLANLFSEIEGITIEHFIIANKIEKAKQLLMQDELSLTQIAEKLSYSSVAHLSSQFKKVAGITASQFRLTKANIQHL